jgi:hypothetical protein
VEDLLQNALNIMKFTSLGENPAKTLKTIENTSKIIQNISKIIGKNWNSLKCIQTSLKIIAKSKSYKIIIKRPPNWKI